jgi:hypothetical protein
LVATIGQLLGFKRPIMSVPPGLGYWACRAMGILVRDVIITREEIQGLMEGRLCVDAPPLGKTKLSDWVQEHKDTLGRRYTSEMARESSNANTSQRNDGGSGIVTNPSYSSDACKNHLPIAVNPNVRSGFRRVAMRNEHSRKLVHHDRKLTVLR